MAEAKTEYLYSTRAENQGLKNAAKQVLGGKGVKITFDREVGAYKLNTEGLSEGEAKAAKAELLPYMDPKAKADWQADREIGLKEVETRRAAAKAREGTTTEPKPERAPVQEEHRFLMYPAHSQKDEFRMLVRETSSVARFQPANANREAHYAVITEVPDRFAAYIGDAARERFFREHAERGVTPQSVNTPLENARAEAQRRAGGAFMAQYKDLGFRLGQETRDPANHQKQLDDMRDATTPQLLTVIKKSREILEPLRNKEAQMRADAAGLSVEQLKAMSFADQKALGQVDGKPVGLVGDEFKLNAQLSRGIAAINAELNGRGVRQKTQTQSREQGQAAENGQKPAEKPAYTVSQEQSVDNDYELAAQGMFRRGRGQGR